MMALRAMLGPTPVHSPATPSSLRRVQCQQGRRTAGSTSALQPRCPLWGSTDSAAKGSAAGCQRPGSRAWSGAAAPGRAPQNDAVRRARIRVAPDARRRGRLPRAAGRCAGGRGDRLCLYGRGGRLHAHLRGPPHRAALSTVAPHTSLLAKTRSAPPLQPSKKRACLVPRPSRRASRKKAQRPTTGQCPQARGGTFTRSVGLATMIASAPVVRPAAIFRYSGASPAAFSPTYRRLTGSYKPIRRPPNRNCRCRPARGRESASRGSSAHVLRGSRQCCPHLLPSRSTAREGPPPPQLS